MGKGRVHELHPRNLVGCMGFKTRWPPRQQTREEGTLLPFHGSICGCPAEGRSEEHTSELQSPKDLVCRLLLEKKKKENLAKKLVKCNQARMRTSLSERWW